MRSNLGKDCCNSSIVQGIYELENLLYYMHNITSVRKYTLYNYGSIWMVLNFPKNSEWFPRESAHFGHFTYVLENTLDWNPSCTFCQHWRWNPRLASCQANTLHWAPPRALLYFLLWYCCATLWETSLTQLAPSAPFTLWLLFHKLKWLPFMSPKNNLPKMTSKKIQTTNTISTVFCRTKHPRFKKLEKQTFPRRFLDLFLFN